MPGNVMPDPPAARSRNIARQTRWAPFGGRTLQEIVATRTHRMPGAGPMRKRRLVARVIMVAMAASLVSRADAAGVCDGLQDAQPALTALRAVKAQPVRTFPAAAFLPAGASFDVVVQQPYDQTHSYRALVEVGETNRPQAEALALLTDALVQARQISADHPLVRSHDTPGNSTSLNIYIPPELGRAWSTASLYLFGCDNRGDLVFISSITKPISDPVYSVCLALFAAVSFYLLAASASSFVDKQNLRWFRYLDPVVLSAGPDGKASLSRLQFLFFSVLVFGLSACAVLRTGYVSDLSPTLLGMLGIAGVGAAAAQGTDTAVNRLRFENWAWLIRKKWLPRDGLAEVSDARWRDIFTTNGNFDASRFQSVVFSLAVAGALLAIGPNDLGSFTVPEALLGVLGLSQAAYVAGKLAPPPPRIEVGGKPVSPTRADLDAAITEARAAEKDFVTTAAVTLDPSPPAGAHAADPPRDLAAAVRRAPAQYGACKLRLEALRTIFEAVTGYKVDAAAHPEKLEPAYR